MSTITKKTKSSSRIQSNNPLILANPSLHMHFKEIAAFVIANNGTKYDTIVSMYDVSIQYIIAVKLLVK
jgi:hypothetical protein